MSGRTPPAPCSASMCWGWRCRQYYIRGVSWYCTAGAHVSSRTARLSSSAAPGASARPSPPSRRPVPILSDDMLTIGFDAEGYPLVCPGPPDRQALARRPLRCFCLKPIAPFPQASLLKTRVHLPRVLARRPRRLSDLFELRWWCAGGARPSREPVQTFSPSDIDTPRISHGTDHRPWATEGSSGAGGTQVVAIMAAAAILFAAPHS